MELPRPGAYFLFDTLSCGPSMNTTGIIIGLIFCAVVGLILLRGLWNMASGGSANKSQQLMRMRVTAQAIAVLVLVAVVYFARPG